MGLTRLATPTTCLSTDCSQPSGTAEASVSWDGPLSNARRIMSRMLGRDVAELLGFSSAAATIIDPFAGSANTLYWILRNIPEAQGIGFELDPQVWQLTQRNLSILGMPVELVHADYTHALRQVDLPDDAVIVAFIAPPWGEAFTSSNGLDLRRTTPPVRETVDTFAHGFRNRMLFAIQVVQNMVDDSLTELTSRLDWSALRIYDSRKAGQNRNGLLLAARGWRPGR